MQVKLNSRGIQIEIYLFRSIKRWVDKVKKILIPPQNQKGKQATKLVNHLVCICERHDFCLNFDLFFLILLAFFAQFFCLFLRCLCLNFPLSNVTLQLLDFLKQSHTSKKDDNIMGFPAKYSNKSDWLSPTFEMQKVKICCVQDFTYCIAYRSFQNKVVKSKSDFCPRAKCAWRKRFVWLRWLFRKRSQDKKADKNLEVTLKQKSSLRMKFIAFQRVFRSWIRKILQSNYHGSDVFNLESLKSNLITWDFKRWESHKQMNNLAYPCKICIFPFHLEGVLMYCLSNS